MDCPRLVCVDPKRVAEFWPHFKHRIEKAINKVGLSDFADIERDVLDGRDLLWIALDGEKVFDAALTTALTDDACEIVAFSGDLKLLLPLLEQLEAFARNEKRGVMRIIGRKGCKRVLKNYTATGHMGEDVVLERRL